ncbi:MAG: hypothetical protein KKE72_11365 [Gammaproteobacteria bacterium]|nr:hypothetical protein [Gammaproteobacteria bacterium]MBU2205284.1 hypothetical protein [Gammaproteobacteria bacterium]
MFGLGKQRLSLSTKECELIDNQISEVLHNVMARLISGDFLVAGGTSVLIKKYEIDSRPLIISICDDGVVDIAGQEKNVESISSLLRKNQ